MIFVGGVLFISGNILMRLRVLMVKMGLAVVERKSKTSTSNMVPNASWNHGLTFDRYGSSYDDYRAF